MALQVPEWLGRGLKPAQKEFEEIEDQDTDPNNRKRLRLHVPAERTQGLGEIELPANTIRRLRLSSIPPCIKMSWKNRS